MPQGLGDANWDLSCKHSSQWAVIEAGSCFHEEEGEESPCCLFAPATIKENEKDVQAMVVESSGSHHQLGVRGSLCSIFFPSWNSLVFQEISDMGRSDGILAIGFTGVCFMEDGSTES